MPQNEKFKRLVRARMERTNETYTKAREAIFAERADRGEPQRGEFELLTVFRSTEHIFKGRWRSVHLRLDVVGGGLRVTLDGVVLGEVAAKVVSGVAHILHGEHLLADGWAARVEPEFDEPDPDLAWEGGRKGGQLALLAPIPAGPGVLIPGSRPPHVSISTLNDGTPNRWRGPSETLSQCIFTAPHLPQLVVELESAPLAGEVSQHVVDDHRRPVLHVDLGLRPDGSKALVVLGEPIAPEGAWNLTSPNFPRPWMLDGAPGGIDPKHLKLLIEIHFRTRIATRPNRGTDALEENQVRELSPKAFGHFGGEAILDGLVAAGLVRRASVAVDGLVATTATKAARRRGPELLDYVMTTALGTETLRGLGRLNG